MPFDKFSHPKKKKTTTKTGSPPPCAYIEMLWYTMWTIFSTQKGLLKKYWKGVVVAPSGWVKTMASFNVETLQVTGCVLWAELLLGYTISIPICFVFASCCNCVAKQFQFLWDDWNFYMVCVCMCWVLSLLFILQF